MIVFIFFLIMLFPVLMITLSFVLVKKKNGNMKEARNHGKTILLAFCIALGIIYFFDDKETLFQCDKEHLRCEYLHSTIANPDLRFVYSFDLRELKSIEIKKATRRTGKYSRRTVYKIVFHLETKQNTFPNEFSYREAAERELGKINRFLHTDRKRYTFYTGHSGTSEFDHGLKYLFFITGAAFILWLLYDLTHEEK